MSGYVAGEEFHRMRKGSCGRFLSGMTLGIVGCGRIGSLVGAAGRGLGMTVLYNDIRPIELDYEAREVDKATLYYGNAKGEIVMLALKDGKETGRIKVAEEAITTPLMIASKVIYGAAGPLLFACDPKAGKVLWTYEGEENFRPPIVAGGALYVGAGDVFYCLR